MKSDSGIIYHEPAKALWVPLEYATRPQRLAVHYKTQLCEGNGRVVKDLQEGWNTITDWGMDSLASNSAPNWINYIHLSDTLGPAKRVASGGVTLTLTSVADPTNVPVVSSAGFFLAGDVGNTLSIGTFGQELKITAFTDSQHVTCATRQGAWLPGLAPGTGPFAAYGVHFTSVSTLANQTQKYNTYDTSATNYNAELNDSGNSRWIEQRIYLSAAAGSSWTINQLGWSDGNAGNNVFGKVNLASPDVVGTGFKYRVQLQVYNAYTPISIASQSVNWGASIGTYNLKIVQECIGLDANSPGSITTGACNFLRPYTLASGATLPGFLTSAQTAQALKWQGDSGYSSVIHPAGANVGASADYSDSAYTGGTQTKTRTVKWSDTLNISAATMLGLVANTSGYMNTLGVYPVTGTITKPSGYWCALTFQLFWTRNFIN